MLSVIWVILSFTKIDLIHKMLWDIKDSLFCSFALFVVLYLSLS